MNNKITGMLILAVAILFLTACGSDKITGKITFEIDDKTIKDGQSTTLKINAKNTGTVAGDMIFKIIPEDPKKLIITYDGSLESNLQPGEDTGTKILKVQGFTDYTSTEYTITTQLIRKSDNKILDEKIVRITVKK